MRKVYDHHTYDYSNRNILCVIIPWGAQRKFLRKTMTDPRDKKEGGGALCSLLPKRTASGLEIVRAHTTHAQITVVLRSIVFVDV